MTDNRMKSICQKRTRIGDNILKVLIYLAAGVAIALLVGIMGYVFVRGLPQVSWQLLSTVQSSLKHCFQCGQGNLWYSGKYHQHDLYHCNYPYHCSADRNRLRHLSERIRKAGKTGADD